MIKNLMKEKLARGENVIGCNISVCAPQLVEVLALSGFDFIFIDCEHSPMGGTECEQLVRTAELYKITPILRVPLNNLQLMIRYLDMGAQGIVVPGIRNKQDAELAVQAIKYYPQGMRGTSPGRAADYGMTMPMKDYVAYANTQTMLLPSMENADAIENIEEIMSVDGLDGLLFGTSDLSQSLGHPGEANHPEVKAAVEKARVNALKCNKIIGSTLRAGEVPMDYFGIGYQMLVTSIPSLLGGAAKELVKLSKG